MTEKAIYVRQNSTFCFPEKLFLLTVQFLLITSERLKILQFCLLLLYWFYFRVNHSLQDKSGSHLFCEVPQIVFTFFK